MTRVVVDAATAAKLSVPGECFELCDEQGNILGRFEPNEKSPAFRAWLQNFDLGMTDQEIQATIAEPGGLSTAEVIALLRGRSE